MYNFYDRIFYYTCYDLQKDDFNITIGKIAILFLLPEKLWLLLRKVKKAAMSRSNKRHLEKKKRKEEPFNTFLLLHNPSIQ